MRNQREHLMGNFPPMILSSIKKDISALLEQSWMTRVPGIDGQSEDNTIEAVDIDTGSYWDDISAGC